MARSRAARSRSVPLSEGSAWGWGSVRTVGLPAASVVLLVVLALVERRVAHPLVNMRTLANPPIAITNVASIFLLAPVAARLIRSWGAARVLTAAGVIIAAGLIMRIFATASSGRSSSAPPSSGPAPASATPRCPR